MPFATPQVAAVVSRELATWRRDLARGVELRSAWLTPLLMVLIIAFTDWRWALPLVGPAAAVFGAMVAINTYALDGTALWQLLTTPGALKADLHGRMAAWALLFGLPSIALAALLWAATGHSAIVQAVKPAIGPGLEIRPMRDSDAEQVLAIYQAGLDTRHASFETTAPS
ncbi:hypothetical protein [Nonomuraea sp. NPDC049504]|uniref:hypothetical protein n=1 Tax=Nonomuraea sp. NPDC049504 TaxID=3154729 RepID=UPI0034188283